MDKSLKGGDFKPLEKFTITLGSTVVIGHAPFTSLIHILGQKKSVQDTERAEVIWVGNLGQSIKAAKKMLKARYCVFIGVCEYIGDAEQGPFDCYEQDGVNSIGTGSACSDSLRHV